MGHEQRTKHFESHHGPAKVRVATFNLQNLALPGQDYYPNERYSDAEFHQKILWTAGQLDLMDADLVGFQEVFQHAALATAIRSSQVYGKGQKASEKYSLHVADEVGNLPRVALLSRLPVKSLEVIRDFPIEARVDAAGQVLGWTSFHRPVLKARVIFPTQQEVIVFVVHLKSKRPLLIAGEDRHNQWHEARGQARSLMLRACETAALRYLILQAVQDSEQAVLVLGDFNDSTHAVTSDILQGRHPQRNYPLDVKKKLWDVLLYSCADIQQRRSYKDVYFTHLHNSHYESLDHILVSQEFVNENPRHIGYVEYMRLYNDHLLDPALTDERLPVWQSDHGQVLVSIAMRPNGGRPE